MTEFTPEQVEKRAEDLYRTMKLYPGDTWNTKTLGKATKRRFRSGSLLVLGLEHAAYLRGYEQAKEDAAKVAEKLAMEEASGLDAADEIRKMIPHQ